MTRRYSTDGNHRPIKHQLIAAGFIVTDYAKAPEVGHPDLRVWDRRGNAVYVEVKQPGKRLRPEQVAWADLRNETVIRAETIDPVIEWFNERAA